MLCGEKVESSFALNSLFRVFVIFKEECLKTQFLERRKSKPGENRAG